jgi:hypothetical protein
VKREALQKNRGGAEIPKDQFTLHDASLGGHMDVALHNVKTRPPQEALLTYPGQIDSGHNYTEGCDGGDT